MDGRMDGQTDRQTDGWMDAIDYSIPDALRGGIIMLLKLIKDDRK